MSRGACIDRNSARRACLEVKAVHVDHLRTEGRGGGRQRHIERVNAMISLATPKLVTPLELLGG